MITQITDASPMCSEPWISGSASTTIVVSAAVIGTPVATTSDARREYRCDTPARSRRVGLTPLDSVAERRQSSNPRTDLAAPNRSAQGVCSVVPCQPPRSPATSTSIRRQLRANTEQLPGLPPIRRASVDPTVEQIASIHRRRDAPQEIGGLRWL
jgi:hypothetical protein